jgi:hypothetical protein
VLEVDGTNLPALLLDTNAEPKVVQPPQIHLSPQLSEVVRLAQSGAEESVILAYIQKAPPYEISSDNIIYLQDLGISDAVLKALVEHSQPGADGSRPAIPNSGVATNPPPVPPVVEAPLTPSNPPPEAVAEFYEPLSPYGTWIDVAPYGWCWQPNVAIVNPGWHPYADRGHWLWSDAGWYWHSYYSWGWAPFHYGRWYQHPRRGWCWAPDRVWGPSWVSWRSSPGYCGWAPLPPGAYFSAGIGWSFHGHHVGHGFSFGLGFPHFTFVATSHFLDHHVHSHSLHHREATVVIKNTTIVNNYAAGPQNRIVNRGIDRRQIETATGTRVREVSVRELPREPRRATMPDRVTRENGSEVVYRPGPDIRVPRRSATATAASLATPGPVPAVNRSARREPQVRQNGTRANEVVSPTPSTTETTPSRRNGSSEPGALPSARQDTPEAPPGGRRVPQRPQDTSPNTATPGALQPRVAPRVPQTPTAPPGRTAPAPGIQRTVPSLPPQTAPRIPQPRTAPSVPAAPAPRVTPPVQPRNVPRVDVRRGSAALANPATGVSQPSSSRNVGSQPAMARPNTPSVSAPRQSSRSVEHSAPSSRSVPSRADSGRSRSRD